MSLSVNYLAVVAAGIAAVVIGFLYYGPPRLGYSGMRILGLTPPPPGAPPAPTGAAMGVIVGLVNAWGVAVLALNLGAATLADGVVLGVFIWFAFSATFTTAQVAFEGRSWNLWLLNNVHNVIVQVVIAAIVTVWR